MDAQEEDVVRMIEFRLKTSRGPVHVQLSADDDELPSVIVYEGEETAIALVRPHVEMSPTDSGALGENCTAAQFVQAMTSDWMGRYQPKRLDR